MFVDSGPLPQEHNGEYMHTKPYHATFGTRTNGDTVLRLAGKSSIAEQLVEKLFDVRFENILPKSLFTLTSD